MLYLKWYNVRNPLATGKHTGFFFYSMFLRVLFAKSAL